MDVRCMFGDGAPFNGWWTHTPCLGCGHCEQCGNTPNWELWFLWGDRFFEHERQRAVERKEGAARYVAFWENLASLEPEVKSV